MCESARFTCDSAHSAQRNLAFKAFTMLFLGLSKNFNSASSISKNKISKVAIKARNKYYLYSNRNHLLEDFVIQPIFATEKENNN